MCFYPIITLEFPSQRPYYSYSLCCFFKIILRRGLTRWDFIANRLGVMAEGQVRDVNDFL